MPDTLSKASSRHLNAAAIMKVASRVCSSSCVAAIIIAVVVLCGWLFDVPFLRSGLVGLPEMRINSALGIIVLALSLWLQRDRDRGPHARRMGKWLAFPIFALATVTVIEQAFSVDLGIELGRMTLIGAMNFAVIALSLCLLDYEIRFAIRPAQLLVAVASVPTSLALLAYAYGLQSLLELGPNRSVSQMALPGALSFFLLSIGVLAARPRAGVVSLITGDSQAARLCRLLLLSSLLIPPSLGLLVVSLSRGRPLEQGADLAVLVLLIVILLCVYSWWIARSYLRIELGRSSALRGLSAAKELLERRVIERTQELDRSKVFLDTVIENIPNMLFIKDAQELRFVSVNRAFEELIGFSRDELIGKNDFDLFPKEQAEFFTQVDRDVLVSGAVRDIAEEPIMTKAGRVASLHTKKLGVTMRGGTRYLLGLAEDITEKKVTQDALRASEERFRTIFENAPLMIVATSSDQKFRMLNATFARMTGYSQEEFAALEDPIEVLLPSATDREMARDVPSRGDGKFREMRIRKKNGDDAYHLWASFKLPDQGEISLGIDITDRKESERALVEAREKALDASKAKSAFLATVSHEIRTPINGVIGMTGLLLDTPLETEQREYAEAIRKSADSLLGIINDILDFSKVEAGKLELEQIEFGPAALFGDVQAAFSFAAKSKGVELSLDIAPELPAVVRGDPGRLNQVLTNLVGNAIKFTSHGSVRLRARSLGSENGMCHLRVEIEDTGIGISPEAAKGIFEAFRQADSTMARRFGGTGLGLSICRRLIEMMGGEIGLESEPGRGSVFWFELTLPCVNADERAALVADSSPVPLEARADERKYRVLVAEDNAVNQKIAVRLLEKLGYRVEAVGDGQEVIAALAAAPYDVVLMDVQMPGVDGFAATRAIRSSPNVAIRSIPIIAMTANAMTGDKEKCLEAGMNDYLAKPVSRALLESTIRRWLPSAGLASSKRDA